MKFRVIGANRESGARMTLEFEAESKAAAERKATQSGMSVNRVENTTDGTFAHAAAPGIARHRSSSVGLLIRMIIVVGIVAFIFWWLYLRPRGIRLPKL